MGAKHGVSIHYHSMESIQIKSYDDPNTVAEQSLF